MNVLQIITKTIVGCICIFVYRACHWALLGAELVLTAFILKRFLGIDLVSFLREILEAL